jgi:predicted DNA-binding ribbon-helix-helix protein
MVRADDLDNRQESPRHTRRGRPRLFDGPGARVSVRLPAPVYDALDRAARRNDASVPDVIRRLLERQFQKATDREFRR